MMSDATTRPTHVTVIGAGIVGICCAVQLQRDGHEVTLIDRDPHKTATRA